MQHCLDAFSLWVNSTIFRGGPSLHYTHAGRPVIASQWPNGGPDCFFRKHRPGGRPDAGRSIGMEGPCVGVKLRSRNGMVEPLSEIGMIAQVSAIQPTMGQLPHPSCDPLTLTEHLQGLIERASSDLDNLQKSQLANTLLEFVDLFPIPGSALTGHTDAVEHTIDTDDNPPIWCAPRHLSFQKIKKKEVCVEEMLSGRQIDLSDNP